MGTKAWIWVSLGLAVAALTFFAILVFGGGPGAEEPSDGLSNPFASIPSVEIEPEPAPAYEGGDKACELLATDESLRSLPAAITLVSDPLRREEARDVLDSGIVALHKASEDADPSMSEAINSAANALELLVDESAEPGEIEAVAVALARLGVAVQEGCGF